MTSGSPGPAPSGGEGASSGAFLERAHDILKDRMGKAPRVMVVLGSGLGGLLASVTKPVSVSFDELPGFPRAGVPGHAGRFVFGELGGRPVLVQAGRFHFYEGHASDAILAPVRLAGRLGVRILILTNAAGSLHHGLTPGSILLLDDQINALGRSPLAGPVQGEEERFPDMSAPFDPELQALALETGRELGIPLARGTYAAVLGPAYETPAEVRMLRGMGVHAVGMSTVPETTAARAAGMKVLAFSLITNAAAGLGPGSLDHSEVLEVGQTAGTRLADLVQGVIARLPE